MVGLGILDGLSALLPQAAIDPNWLVTGDCDCGESAVVVVRPTRTW